MATSTDDFIDWSRATGRYGARLNERLQSRVLSAAEQRLRQLCVEAAREDGIDVAELAARVERGAVSPDEAVQTLINAVVPGVTSTRE